MIMDDNNANPVTMIESLERMDRLVKPPIKLLAKASTNNMYTIRSGTLVCKVTSLVVAMSNIAFSAGIILLEGMSMFGSFDCCIALAHNDAAAKDASFFDRNQEAVSIGL